LLQRAYKVSFLTADLSAENELQANKGCKIAGTHTHIHIAQEGQIEHYFFLKIKYSWYRNSTITALISKRFSKYKKYKNLMQLFRRYIKLCNQR
jgi:hypothetical protein